MSQLNLILLGRCDPRAAAESYPESRAKPAVEAAVDDGIVHGGAHGQPEDRQVDMLDEPVAVDVLLKVAQDEVEVVGQPADGKRHHNQHHGLHKLFLGLQVMRVGTVRMVPGDRASPERVADDAVGDEQHRER